MNDYEASIWGDDELDLDFDFEPTPEDAYEPNDPKHPGFADMWLDWADAQRKREKENGPERCNEGITGFANCVLPKGHKGEHAHAILTINPDGSSTRLMLTFAAICCLFIVYCQLRRSV